MGELGDPMDRGPELYENLNDFSTTPSTSTNSHAQFSVLNVSNLSKQNVLVDSQHNEQQQLYYANQIPVTKTNSHTNSHIPDNDVATSNQFQNDEITVKNELGEIVNIIQNNESNPSSSTQSQSSNNEQSNDNNNIDNYDLVDPEEEDCDCPECVGDLFVKIEEDQDEDDDVQFIEELEVNKDSRPTKRQRLENEQQQAQPNNQTNHRTFITISLKCPQCSQICTDKKALNAHLKSNHSIEKFRCYYKDCNRSFDNTKLLGIHFRTTHQSNSMWPCGYCSGQYKSGHTLLTHYLTQHEQGLFRCSHPNCQFVAELKQTVVNHFGCFHKGHVCQYPACARRFEKACMLKAHELMHRDVRPYRCKWPECQYAGSASKGDTMKHIRTHLKKITEQNSTNSCDPNDYLEVVNGLL